MKFAAVLALVGSAAAFAPATVSKVRFLNHSSIMEFVFAQDKTLA